MKSIIAKTLAGAATLMIMTAPALSGQGGVHFGDQCNTPSSIKTFKKSTRKYSKRKVGYNKASRKWSASKRRNWKSTSSKKATWGNTASQKKSWGQASLKKTSANKATWGNTAAKGNEWSANRKSWNEKGVSKAEKGKWSR
ncbi:MAG: hypothetical protein ACRBBN_02345 [Methyloligellaceae bacterium]